MSLSLPLTPTQLPCFGRVLRLKWVHCSAFHIWHKLSQAGQASPAEIEIYDLTPPGMTKKKKHRRKKKIQKIKPLTISEMNLHTYLVRLAKLAPRTDVQHRSDIDLHTQNDSLRRISSSCDAAAIRGGCSVGGVALKSNNFSALPALSSWNNKLCSGRRWRWWWWW